MKIQPEPEVDRHGRHLRQKPQGRRQERQIDLDGVRDPVRERQLELGHRTVVRQIPESEPERQRNGKPPWTWGATP